MERTILNPDSRKDLINAGSHRTVLNAKINRTRRITAVGAVKFDPANSNVLVIMENIAGHYSGGRVHMRLVMRALAAAGHHVYAYSNMKSFFDNDYAGLPGGERITDIIDRSFRDITHIARAGIKYVIGCPVFAALYAVYFRDFGIPVTIFVYETPNYIRQYRGGKDSADEYWEDFKRILKRVDTICPLSHLGKVKLVEWDEAIGDVRIEPIYPATNDPMISQVPEQEEEHAVCFISRMTPYKGWNDMAEALATLPANLRKDLTWYLIGGTNSSIIEVVRKLKGSGITLIPKPRCNDAEKYRLLKKSKLLVHPSRFEGFGIPPSEAFLCKKPVVAYDMPIFREAYQDKIDYAVYKDKVSLRSKIARLLSDDTYRKQRGQEGFEYATTRYRFKHLIERVSEVFPLRLG